LGLLDFLLLVIVVITVLVIFIRRSKLALGLLLGLLGVCFLDYYLG
jgi:hypothetical protein